MAMLIKGDEINSLVARYCAITGEQNKSEAVRKALAAQIEALSGKETLADRVAKVQRRALEAGFRSVANDIEADKAFMDQHCGEG